MTACCEGAVRVYRVDLGVTAGTPGVYNGVGSMSQYTIASLFVSCEEQVLRVQVGQRSKQCFLIFPRGRISNLHYVSLPYCLLFRTEDLTAL